MPGSGKRFRDAIVSRHRAAQTAVREPEPVVDDSIHDWARDAFQTVRHVDVRMRRDRIAVQRLLESAPPSVRG